MTKWKYVCFERTIIRSRGAETVGQKPAVKRLSGKKKDSHTDSVDVKSPGWHSQSVGLLKWVSSICRGLCLATRLFTLNYLSFSTICVRATWVSKRHQLFWRKLSERTRRIFLLLSMHVTTFSIVVTPTLGKVLIFLDLTNYSPYGKVERYTYNFS